MSDSLPCNFDLQFDIGDISDEEFIVEEELSIHEAEQTENADQDQSTNRPRFQQFTDDEITALEKQKNEKSTTYVTVWGIRILKDWCQYVKVDPNFEGLPPNELARLLRRFYAEVKKQDGTTYSLQSMRGMRAAIHRHLTSPPHNRDINILSSPEFLSANNVFKAVMKKIKRDGNDKSSHKSVIKPGDIRKMFSSGALSTTTPASLLRLVWFFVEFFFCRRGREGLQCLKRDSFVFKTDGEGKEYVTMVFNEATKNHPGDLQHDFQGEKRMYANPDSNVCPVAVMKLYLTKLNPKQDAFFQRPSSSWDDEPRKRKPWFFNAPLGRNKIGKMMKDISQVACLSEVYTNHCIRATAITALNEAGLDSRTIMTLSGHRNESSIKHYCRDSSEKQKKHMSEALHSTVVSGSTSMSTSRPSSAPPMASVSDSIHAIDEADAGLVATVQSSNDTAGPLSSVNSVTAQSVFTGCTFTGNVVINMSHVKPSMPDDN